MKLAQAHGRLKDAQAFVVERRESVVDFVWNGPHGKKAMVGAGMASLGPTLDVLIAIQRQPPIGVKGAGYDAACKIAVFLYSELMGGAGIYLISKHFKYTESYAKLMSRIKGLWMRHSNREIAEAGAIDLSKKTDGITA